MRRATSGARANKRHYATSWFGTIKRMTALIAPQHIPRFTTGWPPLNVNLPGVYLDSKGGTAFPSADELHRWPHCWHRNPGIPTASPSALVLPDRHHHSHIPRLARRTSWEQHHFLLPLFLCMHHVADGLMPRQGVG